MENDDCQGELDSSKTMHTWMSTLTYMPNLIRTSRIYMTPLQ